MFERPDPVCQTCGGDLVAFELEGVEIDRCVACGGTWLDTGEIERISELAGVAPGELSSALARVGAGAPGKRKCPRCGRALGAVTIGAGRGIEIDRCVKGHGFWFDPGEMRGLIQMFDKGEEGAVARFFAEMFRADIER